MYIGPSIRGLVNYGRIFTGSVEDAKAELGDAVAKHPLIAALIIPGEYLPEAKIRIKTAGTALNAQYTKLIRSLNN